MIVKAGNRYKAEIDELIKEAYKPYKAIYKVVYKADSSEIEYETIAYIERFEIVSTLSYYFSDDTIRIFRVATETKSQGRGYLRELIAHLLAEFGDGEITKLGLYTIKETGAYKCFSKLGFKIVSESVADFAIGLDNKPLKELDMIKVIS